MTTGVAYAHACENALGLNATPELARVRKILLELERLWSHLNDIAAVSARASALPPATTASRRSRNAPGGSTPR